MKSHRLKLSRIGRPLLVAAVVAVLAGAGAVRSDSGSMAAAATTTYYVSPSGSDAASGSIDAPWRTLTYAAGKLAAGDVLYLRGGTYREKVKFSHSGTAAAPIRISAYPGERPVVDGNNYTIPAPTSRYSQLVTFSGSYVQADGIEVRDSLWHGVVVSGSQVTLSRIVSHDNMEAGILTWGSTRAVIQDSTSYNNAKSNEGGVHKYGRTSYSTGISAGKGSDGTVLRGNTTYHNWGEGLSTYNATNTLMERNTVYDNSKQVYISDTTGTTARRNLVYCTPGNPYRLSSTVTQHGINLQDEDQLPASSDIDIVNNLVAGCVTNFKWYPFSTKSAMRNVLVANNTFVDATGSTSDASFTIAAPRGLSHLNTRIANNVIVQGGSKAIGSFASPTGGIAFTNNVWSKVPPSSMKGTRSVVGDPRLARSGRLDPGALTGSFFELLPGSPAINAAADLSEVTGDYFGTRRPSGAAPDAGAHEYVG